MEHTSIIPEVCKSPSLLYLGNTDSLCFCLGQTRNRPLLLLFPWEREQACTHNSRTIVENRVMERATLPSSLSAHTAAPADHVKAYAGHSQRPQA